MDATADEYLERLAKNGCSIMFEKGVPAGKLKREMISLANYEGRHLRMTTPQGFSVCPVEVPRAIFDDCLAKKFIEQDGPEDSDGRILFRLTDAGRTRVDIARAVSQMTVMPYGDFK
jgi:hypothetical protein